VRKKSYERLKILVGVCKLRAVGCSSFASKGFWGGFVRACKSSAMCGGVAFLILMRPKGARRVGKN